MLPSRIQGSEKKKTTQESYLKPDWRIQSSTSDEHEVTKSEPRRIRSE